MKRLRSTFRILARSPMLLSKARNRAQISLKKTKHTSQLINIDIDSYDINVHVCNLFNIWHYPDFSGDKLPEVRTRSNKTLVLLSSESQKTPWLFTTTTGDIFALQRKKLRHHYFFDIKSNPQNLLRTIEVWEVIDVCKYVLWNVAILLQTQLKNFKGHWFILLTKKQKQQKPLDVYAWKTHSSYTTHLITCSYLAAVVFHERCGDVHMMTCAWIFSGFFKDGATWFDALGSPGKLHVLDVDQCGVDVFNRQQLVIDAVDLFVLHATLRQQKRKCADKPACLFQSGLQRVQSS